MKKLISTYTKKRILIVMLSIFIIPALTACGGRGKGNGSERSEDGRSYGGLIEGELGKKVSTVFFDFTVDTAKKYSVYQFDDGLYQADNGNTYLVVTVTVANTYDKDLPMSISDFTLDFSGNESEEPVTGFGSVSLNDESFMDNIYTLKIGETITKAILFTVPDKAEYFLGYKEYYEDKFEGDSYEISMVPITEEGEVSIEASTSEAADSDNADNSSEAVDSDNDDTSSGAAEADNTDNSSEAADADTSAETYDADNDDAYLDNNESDDTDN